MKKCAAVYDIAYEMVDPHWLQKDPIGGCAWEPKDTKQIMHLYIENGHCRLLVEEKYLSQRILDHIDWKRNCKLYTGVIHKKGARVDTSKHIVFDVESLCLDIGAGKHDHQPRVVCWYDGNKKYYVRGEGCLESFVEWLSKQKGSYTIWAHNGGKYDYPLSFDILLKYCSKDNMYPLRVINDDNNICRMEGKFGKAHCVFKDSCKLLSRSLGQLAKDLNTPHQKTDIDVKNMTEEEIMSDRCVDYCINDCIVLWEVLHRFQHFCLDKYKVDPLAYSSISGYARGIFLSRYYEAACIYKLTKETDAYIREAYIGGTNWITLGG